MSKGDNVSVDHLAEARRLADDVTSWAVSGSPEEKLAWAIEHLADAIEELRPAPRPEFSTCPSCGTEHTDLSDAFCYDCSQPPGPETVSVLLQQHRDRVWDGSDGKRWRWNNAWSWWETPDPSGVGHQGFVPGASRQALGPFTAVEVP